MPADTQRASKYRPIDDHVDETEEIPMEQETASQDQLLSVYALPTVAAGEERKKLRRSVGRLDTAFMMLAAIIVLDTLGAVSSYGAQSFTWLIVMIIFFLIPRSEEHTSELQSPC